MANTTPSATTTTTTKASPGSSPGGFDFTGGAGIVAGGSQPNPAGGTSNADIGQKIFVPSDGSAPWSFLQGQGDIGSQHQVTISEFIALLNANPEALHSWYPVLQALGYKWSKPGNPTTQWLDQQIETVATQAAGAGGNLSIYVQNQINNQSGTVGSQAGAAPNTYGSQHFYRGGVTEIGLTSKDAVQTAGNAVAQELLGRNLNPDEIKNVTQRINQQEYAAGGVHAKVAEAQQASYLEAVLGGGGTSGPPVNPKGGPSSNFGSGTTASGGPVGPFKSGYNVSWEEDILNRLGAPITPDNIKALDAWRQAEGGNAAFNPFNTTRQMPGSTKYNSVGVQNFASYEDGINATVATLNQKNMAPIKAALQAGGNAMDVAKAIAATPWGTGPLVEKVLGGQVASQMLPGGSGGPNSVNQGGSSTSTTGTQGSGDAGSIDQVQPGQVQTVGGSEQLNLPSGQAYVLPPVVGVSSSPLSPEQGAASYIQNQESGQFQAHNLLNVFDVISKMAGSAVNPQGRPSG